MSTPKARPATATATASPRSAPGRAGEVTVEPLAPLHNCCVGIDPGLDGGIAWIGDRLGVAGAMAAPTVESRTSRRREFDRDAMVAILGRFHGETLVAIEKVNAAPMHGRRQGTGSMFSFGKGYGLWLGILQVMAIPFVEVDPRKWKKAVLSGTAKDKAAAIRWAQTVHPGVNLKATPRSRKPDSGIADALCLAEYARQQYRLNALIEGSKC